MKFKITADNNSVELSISQEIIFTDPSNGRAPSNKEWEELETYLGEFMWKYCIER